MPPLRMTGIALSLICASTWCAVDAQGVQQQDSESPEDLVAPPDPAVVITDLDPAALADSVRKYRYLSHNSWELRERANALAYLEHYVKYRPDHPAGFFFFGRVYVEAKNYTAAKPYLLEALARDSLHINTNLLLHRVYDTEGVADSAAQAVERILLKKPGDLQKRRALADLYRQQRRLGPAIAQYGRIARTDSSAEILELLADLNQEFGQTSEALSWRRRLHGSLRAEVAPQNPPDGTLDTRIVSNMEGIFDLHRSAGQHAEAFATLGELATADPPNRLSYFTRQAEFARELGWDERRVEALERVVELDPGDVRSLASLAEWHLNQGNIGRTQKCLELGLAASSTDAHLLVLRGDFLLTRGDEDGAVASYELALADPRWQTTAQQRIWQVRPPETEEEKAKREFFGD